MVGVVQTTDYWHNQNNEIYMEYKCSHFQALCWEAGRFYRACQWYTYIARMLQLYNMFDTVI